MKHKQTHNSLATTTAAEAAWSRLTTGSMQLTAGAVRGYISCSRIATTVHAVAAQFVCKPMIIALGFTYIYPVKPKAKICTAINLFRVMDTGTHRVSIIPNHGWQPGNPATFPYMNGHLAKRGSHGPVNLGNLTSGVGLLPGPRQKWVFDRAGVYNLAQNKTLAYTPAGPNRQ